MGAYAVDLAIKGENSVMASTKRISDEPYRWKLTKVPLSKVANVEKKLPSNFISSDGYHITNACRKYLTPLILGEDYPRYYKGIPIYSEFKNKMVKKKKL